MEMVSASGAWGSKAPIATPADLQVCVDDFSESYCLSAVQNVGEYFRRLGAYGTPGGKTNMSGPLRYDPRRLQPNASEIGALGEGVAGYYLEQVLGLTFEVRPFGVNPDFVFSDPATRVKRLVQVKTSLGAKRPIITDAIQLLEVLAKTKMLRKGRYIADVVSVGVLAVDDFAIRHLVMEEV